MTISKINSNSINTDEQTLSFSTSGTERVIIDSSGNVGIGTSLPSALLGVNGRVTLGNQATSGTAGAGGMIVGAGAFYIQSSENQNSSNKAPIVFSNIGGSSESMRIDSSGRLLIGHTTAKGYALDVDKANLGAASFNRTGTDGEIVSLRKNGTTVGSIGVVGSVQPYFANSYSNTGIRIYTSGFTACNNAGGFVDNAQDVGASSVRWDDIYATNGTIQTSDANEKQQIASLTDAEMTAAKAISKLFKTFKWNDKVEAKGDAARRHAGVIAQDVQQAMTDAGLDAGDYAFFISATWWETQTEVPAVEADEENGVKAQDAYTRTDTYNTAEEAPEGATERTRLGIRYPELLAFIGAATEQRLASIESRLDALENN